jgi:hypothetical protein
MSVSDNGVSQAQRKLRVSRTLKNQLFQHQAVTLFKFLVDSVLAIGNGPACVVRPHFEGAIATAEPCPVLQFRWVSKPSRNRGLIAARALYAFEQTGIGLLNQIQSSDYAIFRISCSRHLYGSNQSFPLYDNGVSRALLGK